MRDKFITGILTLAVVLGLLLVPGMGVSAGDPGPGLATIEMTPTVVQVLPSEAFDVNVTINNPNELDINAAGADMVWSTPSMLGVTGFDAGDMPQCVGSGWDNATGEVYYSTLGTTPIPYVNASSIALCTVHFVAGTSEGEVTLNFTPGITAETSLYDKDSEDVLNWSALQTMVVKIGTPKLNVDVSPVGTGDVEIGGASPPAVYPNCTDRGWGEVVTLEAVDPAPGWHFNEWIGDVDNTTDNPTTITISALKNNVTAVFCELPCELDVDPETVPQLKARFGENEDSDTVTVKNVGGGTLRWQVGYPPIWSVGDSWTYMNTYDSVPNASSGGFDPLPNPYWQSWVPCLENNTPLVLAVIDEDNCTYTAVADWPYADPQRTDSTTKAPLCMHDAVVTVDKCNLDYLQQVANLTLYMSPTEYMPVTAIVNWAYDGCHGWPYSYGKSWSYNMTIIMPAPVGTKTVPAHAMVTAGPVPDPIGAGFTDCYVITHFLTNPAVDTFMQQYWSDTARNFVFQWDGGTFAGPLIGAPVDVRAFVDMSITGLPGPSCCDAPSWLSFDKMSCNLGADETAVITVTANTTGLATDTYHNGSFCISSCCCTGVQHKCVNVSLWVQPATTLTDLHRGLPPDAMDPDAEYPGDSFFVYVNFSSLGDNFNSIGVTDYAPAGWLVETADNWCNPPASYNKSNYNKAEYAWAGAYNASATFSAKYKVTIPETASAGSNFWPECSAMPCPPCGGSPINNYPAWVDYWIGPDGPFETMICEDREKVVTVPGCVTGETRDVLGNVLDTVTVNLWEDDLPLNTVTGDVWEDQDTSSIVGSEAVYKVCADDTGMYYLVASKYCYFTLNTRPTGDGGSMPGSRNPAYPDYIDFSTPILLEAENVTDFVGDYGLVCRAASLSMAMEAVNHMLFVPLGDDGITLEPDWQLSSWKVSQVVHSWQIPCGCNC